MISSPPVTPQRPQSTWGDALAYPLACLGAMAGAAFGVVIAWIASRNGFYALIIIGVLAGFGANPLSHRGHWPIAILAACIALLVSLWTEWWLFPFVADDSLHYFIAHLGDLPAFRLMMHVVGAAVAGYIAYRR